MRKIILASKSPRRRELFKILGVPFVIKESDYEENLTKKMEPKELAITMSQGKARTIAKKQKDAIVIAADTLISFQNKVLGKPRSEKDAFSMLSQMSGKVHSVITGYTILDTKTKKNLSKAVETKVYFRKLKSQEIKNYIKTSQFLDKAGAYGIQELGQLLIEKIEGNYSNVVGLPLGSLVQSLKQFDINIL